MPVLNDFVMVDENIGLVFRKKSVNTIGSRVLDVDNRRVLDDDSSVLSFSLCVCVKCSVTVDDVCCSDTTVPFGLMMLDKNSGIAFPK